MAECYRDAYGIWTRRWRRCPAGSTSTTIIACCGAPSSAITIPRTSSCWKSIPRIRRRAAISWSPSGSSACAPWIARRSQRGQPPVLRARRPQIPIERIYNRAIVDELERRDIRPALRFPRRSGRGMGRPSQLVFPPQQILAAIPAPSGRAATQFLDRVANVEQPERYVLKPLYSFAGAGVIVGPTRGQLAAVPPDRRSHYLLQERVDFRPVIETPAGPTKSKCASCISGWTNARGQHHRAHGARRADGRRSQQGLRVGRRVRGVH